MGKTHIAQAFGHAACRRGYSVVFAKCARVFAELAGGRADGTWEARLRRLAGPDVLILDDFGLRDVAGFPPNPQGVDAGHDLGPFLRRGRGGLGSPGYPRMSSVSPASFSPSVARTTL